MAEKVNKELNLKEIAKALVKEYKTQEAIFGEGGAIKQLFGRTLEACLEGEMTEHLGYERYSREGEENNSRNGYGSKKIITEQGEMEISIPRDRNSSFEPQIIKKGQNRMPKLDDQIISMYARGMSIKDI